MKHTYHTITPGIKTDDGSITSVVSCRGVHPGQIKATKAELDSMFSDSEGTGRVVVSTDGIINTLDFQVRVRCPEYAWSLVMGQVGKAIDDIALDYDTPIRRITNDAMVLFELGKRVLADVIIIISDIKAANKTTTEKAKAATANDDHGHADIGCHD